MTATLDDELNQVVESLALLIAGQLTNPFVLLERWEGFLLAWKRERSTLSHEQQVEFLQKVQVLQQYISVATNQVGKEQGISPEEVLELLKDHDALDPEIRRQLEERKAHLHKVTKELDRPKASKKVGKKVKPKRSKWVRS